MSTQTLSDHMSFDHVIRVHENGAITDGPPNVHAPDLYDDELHDDTWSLLDGYSGHQLPESAIMAALEDGSARYKRVSAGVRHDTVVFLDGREFWRYS